MDNQLEGTGPSGYFKISQNWGAASSQFDFTGTSIYIAMASDNFVVDVRCDGVPLLKIPSNIVSHQLKVLRLEVHLSSPLLLLFTHFSDPLQGFGFSKVVQFPNIDSSTCTTFSLLEIIFYNYPADGNPYLPNALGIIAELKGNPTLTVPGYTDSCEVVGSSLLSPLSPGSVFPIGNSTVTYQVLDQTSSNNCS